MTGSPVLAFLLFTSYRDRPSGVEDLCNADVALSARELACHALLTTVFAAQRLICLLRECPLQTASDRAIGHATGTSSSSARHVPRSFAMQWIGQSCNDIRMADPTRNQRDVELLTIALDHVTRLYDSRMTNSLQVLNYFLVAAAVLSAAYVSAINGKLHAIGCAIGLLGVALSSVTYLVGRRQRDVARLAEVPMKEIEEILAENLKIGSLRMIDHAETQRKPGGEARLYWRMGYSPLPQSSVLLPVLTPCLVARYLFSSC